MKKFFLAAVLFLSFYQTVTPQEKYSFQINSGPIIVDHEFSKLGFGASALLQYQLSERFDLSLRCGYLNWLIEDTEHHESGKYYGVPVLAV